MQRVKTPTAAAAHPGYTATGSPGFFKPGDPLQGIPATVPGAEWFNMIQEELANLVASAGLPLNAQDDTQVRQAVQALVASGLGAITTPPLFDADESPATTAFVQRALGNFRGLRGITESCTLTAGDIGMLIIVGGAGPITINLPPATVCLRGGAGFEFAHSGLYPVTVQCDGTDKVVLGTTGQGLSSIVLQPADSLAIKSAGSLYWYSHGGSAQLPYVARYETMWIGAGAMVPCKTNGAVASAEESTNYRLNVDTLAFGSVADSSADCSLKLPETWDKGYIRARLHWAPATGATAGQAVGWVIAACATGDGDALDRALGTAVTVGDVVLAGLAGVEHVTGASAALVASGSPAQGDRLHLRVTRDADYAVGGAALPVAARLLGVEIQYRCIGRAEVWS